MCLLVVCLMSCIVCSRRKLNKITAALAPVCFLRERRESKINTPVGRVSASGSIVLPVRVQPKRLSKKTAAQ